MVARSFFDALDAADFDRRQILAGVAASALLRPAHASARGDSRWIRAELIVRKNALPKIGAARVDITSFGAIADGLTPATAAIARAIAMIVRAGGGRVVVPPGRYLTGAIRLESGVEFHLMAGATLVFSTNPADYPLVATLWEGVECINYAPLVYATDAHDVALTGHGTLDGQGAAWWPWSSGVAFGWRPGLPDQRPARAALFAMAEAGVPVAERVFGPGHFLRPAMVEFQRCSRVLIEGVTLRDSPCWTVHPVLSRDITMRGVTVIGHGPNTDGCDPESVCGMLIERCVFDTGDDCIAIKSGRNADGRRIAVPAEDIVIRDCRMKAGHGGLVVGSEISGGARNIFLERCTMDSPDLWYAIRFKNNAMRGGAVAGVHVRDVTVGHVGKAALTCDFTYEEGASGAFRPSLRDVTIERMTVAHCPRVVDVQGLASASIGDITLRDCRFDGTTMPSIVAHIDALRIERITVDGKPVTRL